jgi:hypothetical protein
MPFLSPNNKIGFEEDFLKLKELSCIMSADARALFPGFGVLDNRYAGAGKEIRTVSIMFGHDVIGFNISSISRSNSHTFFSEAQSLDVPQSQLMQDTIDIVGVVERKKFENFCDRVLKKHAPTIYNLVQENHPVYIDTLAIYNR